MLVDVSYIFMRPLNLCITQNYAIQYKCKNGKTECNKFKCSSKNRENYLLCNFRKQ